MSKSAILLCGLSLLACANGGAPGFAQEAPVSIVADEEVASFYERATAFYRHLEGRRFNSVTTYRDRFFRDFFRDEVAFADYYAALARDLDEIVLERNQPLFTEVEEFLVDGPGTARVRVRIRGENGKPLRWWSVSLIREDRWERHEGRWWVMAEAG
jgi:hypothetical protein